MMDGHATLHGVARSSLDRINEILKNNFFPISADNMNDLCKVYILISFVNIKGKQK